MKTVKDIIFYILGIVTVLGTFTVVGIMLFQGIPQINSEILYMLLGVVATKFADVLSYFYGSSQSSKEKTDIIANGNKPRP